MRKILFIVLILASKISFSQAVIYSNEFLSVGIGARALAMSNSVTASATDVTAGYWNPAGLSLIDKKYEIGIMHSEFFAGLTKFDYAGFAYKISDSSSFAVTLLRYGTDDIQNTLELVDQDGNVDYSKIKKFSVADYAFLLSYSKKTIIDGLSIGANAKIIYRNIGSFANAYGFGFDIGAIYNKNKWHTGITIRDASSTFNAWFFDNSELEDVFAITANELPKNGTEITLPKMLLGVARDFKINKKIGLLAEIDVDLSFDGEKNTLLSTKYFSAEPHLGIELNYNSLIYLRAGVGNFTKIIDFSDNSDTNSIEQNFTEEITFMPSIGLGIKLLNFSLDYALTDIGGISVGLYSNIFSLSYRFK